MFKTKPWELTDTYKELAKSKRIKHEKWFDGGRTGEGRIDVEDKNFVDAFLVHHGYEGAKFVGCDFTASRIVGSFLEESELVECFFNRSNLDSSFFNRALIKNCQIIATTYIRLGEFNNAKVEECNFSQSDLCESRWNCAVVKNVNFEQVTFQVSQFNKAHFINCNFRYADLYAVEFHDAIFDNCDFRHAHLEVSELKNTTFNNCGFYGCIGTPDLLGECEINAPDLSPEFDGSNIGNKKQIFSIWGFDREKGDKAEIIIGLSKPPQWLIHIPRQKRKQQRKWIKKGCVGEKPISFVGKNFSRVISPGGCFQQADFSECDFTLADFKSANFKESSNVRCIFDSGILMDLKAGKAVFEGCSFQELIADRSNFEETQLQGCDWTNSEIYKGIWYAVEADKSVFAKTNWFKTNWYEGKFTNCDFSNAELWKTVGEKAVFEGCNFQKVDFWEFEAKDAVFKNCDFRGANLRLLRMENTIFENCAFYGCQNMPYHDPEFDSVSQIIAPDLSANFDGSKVIETNNVQEFLSLLKQRQEQQERLDKVTTRLSEINQEMKRLDDRINNLSGGSYDRSIHTRIKELKAKSSKLIGEKNQLEREKADLEQEIDQANL